jgi:hypothetical protein
MKRLLPLLLLVGCGSAVMDELPPLPPITVAVAPVQTTVAVTTTTTTVPPTTTTTINPIVETMGIMYPRCAEWLPLLLEVGGNIDDWPTWSRVLWVESRCIDGLDNNGSVGLAQVQWNVHKVWALQMGIDRDMMKIARHNLTFAVALQKSSGWKPWAYLKTK